VCVMCIGEGANFENTFFSWSAYAFIFSKKTSLRLLQIFVFGEKKLARLTNYKIECVRVKGLSYTYIGKMRYIMVILGNLIY